MNKYIATVIDTAGIQPYIFSSNRLRENIGASYLVDQATGDWVNEALAKLGRELSRSVYIPKKDSQEEHIEDGRLIAELVYAGGGNTVLLFEKLEYAQQFMKILSKKILCEAPGLNIIAAHKEFEWSKNNLKDTIDELINTEIASKKQERIPSSPLLGLSVTVACASSQLVAFSMSKEFGAPKESSYPVSREVGAKLGAVPFANDKLREIFPRLPDDLEFPYEFDNLGRSKGESSYIAVVHADGNQMGKRFENIAAKDNRDFIIKIRHLSGSINQAGKKALVAVLCKVIHLYDRKQFEIKDNYLPFRPLVYGGDDVTFVCDGRLGLSLAAAYLNAFEEQRVSDGFALTACAGICIVKTHYPFARAYALSEALCSSAKKFLRDETENYSKPGFSSLDWHIASSGLLGSVSDIREREYTVSGGGLTMRPVRLKSQNNEWRTWNGFSEVVEEFIAGEDWKDRRNKVIALREVLRKGPEATKQFLKAYGLTQLPKFPEANQLLEESGWWDERCGYFDAIEAMEFYMSVKD